MPESGPRVVLLARPGAACDRVRMGLVEAGAELVLEADPTVLEPQQLIEARPQLAMVVLDAATEPAFDRLEPVLLDLGAEVMLEEADVAAAREGWDAARWVRHLAAKLHRHGDVLPPGGSGDAMLAAAPQPVVAAEAVADVPAAAPDSEGGAPFAAPLDFDTTEPAQAVAGDAPAFEFDFASDDLALPAEDVLPAPVPAHPLSDDFTPGVETGEYLSFDPVAAETAGAAEGADQIVGFDFALHDDFSLPTSDDPAAGASSPALDLVFESELAPIEPRDAFAATPVAPTLGADADLSIAPVLDAAPASPATGDFGAGLELALDDGPIAATPAPASRFTRDLGDLERRIASLELVDTVEQEAPGRAAQAGAVAILAGIGGPDAVRQLLGALPAEFPRPVLVHQRLDGARHDRLVAQMQRASSLPVELAVDGRPAAAGVVYIVPSGVGVAATPEGLRFDGNGDLLTALVPADSAVVLLSGTDLADVERLAAPGWAEGLLAAQAAEGCYDATAPMALAARGGISGQPAELAQRLVERWNAR